MPKKPNKIYKNTLVEYSWLVLAIVYECLRLYNQTKELDIAITDALLSVFLGLQFHERRLIRLGRRLHQWPGHVAHGLPHGLSLVTT